MKLQDVMSAAHLSAYAEVSLLIFLGVFVGVACDLWASRDRSQAMGLLPLDDGSRAGSNREQP
jgi:hypothetical protein